MAVEGDFNPGKSINSLASTLMGGKVESPEDALKLMVVTQQFIIVSAAIVEIGKQELEDALLFYESIEGQQPNRPRKVVRPIEHASAGIRLMAGRLPKAAKSYRTHYAEDMARAAARRSATNGGVGGRKFKME
jgi:hypothetical protein